MFTCAVTSEESLNVKWYLNTSSTEILININKTLSDGTMATFGSDYRSPLTLSNINRVWNGATVHCAVKTHIVIDQPEPFPVISVWCELLQTIVNKLCYNYIISEVIY